jgi:hypothetical protein
MNRGITSIAELPVSHAGDKKCLLFGWMTGQTEGMVL